MWQQTEPPLTIGRGLLITTGAIGGLLSLAVLWAMLPSSGRGSVAAPTVVSSTSDDLTDLISSARMDTLVATSIQARATSTALATIAMTIAPAQQTETTIAETQPEVTTQSEGSNAEQTAPVAVGVGDSMIITTARAVEGRTSLSLMGADGQQHDVPVLIVDRDQGLAVLSPEAASMTSSYGVGPAVASGDLVTVLSQTPVSAKVTIDASGRVSLDAWGDSIAEGTPVVNANGLLVGVCSHGPSGPELLSVANLAALTPSTTPAAARPWMGVHVVDATHGAPVIDGIDSTGPAATAGMVAGDAVTAIGGTAVTTVEQLKAALATHAPGDVVVVTVTRADQTSVQISVTLGSAPSM